MKSRWERGGVKNFLFIVTIVLLPCVFYLIDGALSLTTLDFHSASAKSKTQHNDNEHRVDSKTTPKPLNTLVHFDPYFMGGFRNQHMRFVAFVAHAVKHNISQILLPSLRWMDHSTKKSLPHELIFDVRYWNSRAEEVGLPTLVDYDPHVLEGVIVVVRNNDTANNDYESDAMAIVPCWNETSGLYSGLDEAVLRGPRFKPRRTDILDLIGKVGEPYSHCRRTMGDDENAKREEKKLERASSVMNNDDASREVRRLTHLVAHGGVMRLWWEYSGLQGDRTTKTNASHIQIHHDHMHVEKAIYELLRPNQNIQSTIDNVIDAAMQNASKINAPKKNVSSRLLAVHPRVEQEMLVHRCSKHMESNLTRALEQLRTFSLLFDAGNSTLDYRFDMVFMAVSKVQVEQKNIRNGELGDVMDENRNALRRARKFGLFGGGSGSNNNTRTGIPMFESGIESAEKLQFRKMRPMSGNATSLVSAESLGVLELCASVINFFTAVAADIFVGVKGSTFSTDVFSVRYYQRKEEGGAENYIMSPDGITRLVGPAAPHSCESKR